MVRKLTAIFCALCVVFAALPVGTRAASTVAGATEITQVANFIQLLDQAYRIARQAKDVKRQLKLAVSQGKRLASGELRVLLDVPSIAQQVSNLYFQTANLSQRYRVKHPGYEEATHGPRRTVRGLEMENQRLILESISSIETQVGTGMKQDSEIREALIAKSQSVEGTLQALQVSHAFLSEVIRQLHLLRGAFLQFHHMVAGLEGSRSQERLYEEKRREQKPRPFVPAPPAQDWSGQAMWRGPRL